MHPYLERLAWVLNRMCFFSPVRVLDSTVWIDTSPIRKSTTESFVVLRVSMQFMLVYGAGSVWKQVEVVWPPEMELLLSAFIRTEQAYRTVEFLTTEDEDAVALQLRVPKRLTTCTPIPIKGEVNRQMIKKLDKTSLEIECGAYTLIWQSPGKKKTEYKPKRKK